MTRGGDDSRVLGYIGIARKAGKLVIGAPAVCDALRRGAGSAVFAANDISDATHKRLSDKCAYYGAVLTILSVGTDELARRIGKTGAVAAVMITDAGIERAALLSVGAECSDIT